MTFNNKTLNVSVNGKIVRISFMGDQPWYTEVFVSRAGTSTVTSGLTRTIWHSAAREPLTGLAKAAFTQAMEGWTWKCFTPVATASASSANTHSATSTGKGHYWHAEIRMRDTGDLIRPAGIWGTLKDAKDECLWLIRDMNEEAGA